jgi:hypothetical protein
MSNREIENTLLTILEELRMIRQHLVPPPLPTKDELERDITVALGVGPDEVFNK